MERNWYMYTATRRLTVLVVLLLLLQHLAVRVHASHDVAVRKGKLLGDCRSRVWDSMLVQQCHWVTGPVCY